MLYFVAMGISAFRGGNAVARRGVTFALVAAGAFAGGLLIGNSGSAAAIVNQIPLVGDGLDATPDPNVDLADFWKAWNALKKNYVVTHSSSTLPTTREQIYGAIQGLAEAYGDPYTTFFPPAEAKAFIENISGSFAGVGMEVDIKDGILTVVAPLKGTPADKAGIKAGDQILAIDGKSTEGVPLDKAIGQIRGQAGTTVTLAIVREGKALEVKVVRDTIQVPETEEHFDEKTSVYRIQLYEFTSNSGSLFNRAFQNFKESGAKNLIIDLRGNPGGYLESAVDIASHFIPRGGAVVTEDFGEKQPQEVHSSRGYNDLPRGTSVVVLIDGGSASASEIFAGALQDHGIATIIGTRSFGKGSVQTLIDIGGGSLKITIARWVTPDGHWIMDNGVTPDIVATVTKEDIDAGRDPQVERAVQFLTTGK
jgi:carboxyl-terminal processing protease